MALFGRSERVETDTVKKTRELWEEVNERRARLIREQYDRETAGRRQ